MNSPLLLIVALIAVQRLVELRYAANNSRKLLARGAVEVAPEQHRYFVALHATWLIALLVAVPLHTQPDWLLIALIFALQLARLWIILTLGPFWTTRIITLPGAPLVRRGPYRILRHPNYTVVALEIALLPLAFHAPLVALVFSLLNAGLLAWRIRAEDRALDARRP